MAQNGQAGAERPQTGAPAVILVEPQLGENVGTAARAMANFSLSEMRLVAPRDGWPNERAVKAASGADFIVEAARVFDTVEEAVADLNVVLATTARRRDMIKPVYSPETAAREMTARLADPDVRAGILFGRERTGLGNDEVALADGIIMAPVNTAFASLNLAQAVLLVGYEWFKLHTDGALGRETPVEAAGREGLYTAHTRAATKEELIGLFEHLERELDEANFLRPPEKRPAMVRNLRNMLSRANLTEQEVRTLRGVIASLVRNHERG